MKAANQTVRRLRVLIAMEAAGGGAARHVIDLAEGLLKRNHEVLLVYSSERAEDWCSKAIETMPGLVARRIPMRRAVGADDLRLALQLRRIIEEMGPFDVLHGHSSKAGALVRLAGLGKPSPCIYTPHAFITLNPELGSAAYLSYRIVEWLLSYLARTIICVSEQELDHALSLGIHSDKLSLVHNGIAPLVPGDRTAMRSEFNIGEHEFCVGFVGRLSAQKSVDRLITAFASASHDRHRMRLVIVGDGPDRGELEELANRLHIADRVLFAGSRNGIVAMAAFDVFALPSRYEAFPYVLLEAAAQGLPVVMTDTGGAHSVVKHGSNGFVVPQDGNEEFANCLSRLADDRDLVRRMSRSSMFGAREFSLDNMVEGTLSVYADALMTREEPDRVFQ